MKSYITFKTLGMKENIEVMVDDSPSRDRMNIHLEKTCMKMYSSDEIYRQKIEDGNYNQCSFFIDRQDLMFNMSGEICRMEWDTDSQEVILTGTEVKRIRMFEYTIEEAMFQLRNDVSIKVDKELTSCFNHDDVHTVIVEKDVGVVIKNTNGGYKFTSTPYKLSERQPDGMVFKMNRLTINEAESFGFHGSSLYMLKKNGFIQTLDNIWSRDISYISVDDIRASKNPTRVGLIEKQDLRDILIPSNKRNGYVTDRMFYKDGENIYTSRFYEGIHHIASFKMTDRLTSGCWTIAQARLHDIHEVMPLEPSNKIELVACRDGLGLLIKGFTYNFSSSLYGRYLNKHAMKYVADALGSSKERLILQGDGEQFVIHPSKYSSYFKCYHTSKWHPIEQESFEVKDGDGNSQLVHIDYKDEYTICEDCDSLIHEDDLLVLSGDDTRRICSYCGDDNGYYRCYKCDSYSDDYQIHHGDTYCSCCMDDLFICDGCECIGEVDEALSLRDAIYCESCYNDNKVIHRMRSYGYKQDLMFYALDENLEGSDSSISGCMGMELETITSDYDERECVVSEVGDVMDNILDGESYYVTTEDSSLQRCCSGEDDDCNNSDCNSDDGIEWTFQPMTMASFYTQQMTSILDAISDRCISYDARGCEGEKVCGIHISLNRKEFTRDDCYRLQKFIYDEKMYIKKLAMRGGGNYSDYSYISNEDELNPSHNGAIMFSSSRIELRMFQGTLDRTSLLSFLEFANGLQKFILGWDMDRNPNYRDFVLFIQTLDANMTKNLLKKMAKYEHLELPDVKPVASKPAATSEPAFIQCNCLVCVEHRTLTISNINTSGCDCSSCTRARRIQIDAVRNTNYCNVDVNQTPFNITETEQTTSKTTLPMPPLVTGMDMASISGSTSITTFESNTYVDDNGNTQQRITLGTDSDDESFTLTVDPNSGGDILRTLIMGA